MGGRLRILVCLAVSGLVLLAPAPALAQGGGTTTSAGDQQYIDPLTTQTHTTAAPKTTAPASTTPAPAPSASPSSSSSANGGSSSSTTPSASAGSSSGSGNTTTDAPSGTLPFTGLNVGVLVAVGLGLIGGGLLLRRVARRA